MGESMVKTYDQSPAVKAMLRAASICETYYADRVWTDTLARGAAFDLCQALKSEATKIAAEEHAYTAGTLAPDAIVIIKQCMAWIGEGCDENGDSVGAQPDGPWEEGFAAGVRLCYRILKSKVVGTR
jgi:hypothetical protein